MADELFQTHIVQLWSNSSLWKNDSLSPLAIETNQFEKAVGTKKFLQFFPSPPRTICLMRYSRQALFPPSTRATLKSFGGVFAKTCYQWRGKWDETFGIASAGFQVIGQCSKPSLSKIYLKDKGFSFCWFQTQTVWENFQRKQYEAPKF